MGQTTNKKKKTENEIVWEWVLFISHYSGAKFIYHKFITEKASVLANPDYRAPSTFFLWTLGIYMALYGLTSTKYELALDRAESRLSTVVAQLSTTNEDAFNNLIAQIPEIQKIKTPIKPGIFKPVSVVLSLFIEKENQDIIGRSIKVVEAWKTKLHGVNLYKANLTKAYLLEANLTKAKLGEANLTNTNTRDVKNAPEGFKKEALTKGAVDMGQYEWRTFIKNGYNKWPFYNIKWGTYKSKPWVLKTDAVEMVWEEPVTDIVQEVMEKGTDTNNKEVEDSQVVPYSYPVDRVINSSGD